MSDIHLRQIKSYLQKTFNGLIDLSDWKNKSEKDKDKESVFLSRSLAAFSLKILADTSPEEASKSVVDGAGDNGIDAIYFDKRERILYVVQSKWKNSSKGSIDRGSIQKFIQGFKDLVNIKYDRFNPKLNNKVAEINEALEDTRTKFELIVIYSSQDPLADEPKRDIDDLLIEMNDPTDMVSLQVLRQSNIHSIISQGLQGVPINLDVLLCDWGQTREPYQSYYGQVSAQEVADWWNSNYLRLFAQNIRVFLGDTDVNEGIIKTVKNEPEKLWYYNNGITALCSTIVKKPLGGSGRDTGIFECQDVKIVNGAQTVGSIARASQLYPEQAARAKVHIRFISLEKCSEEFEKEITKYNNTQNRIDRRDFVSLDIEQERIKNELQLEEISYVYKSGELIPDKQKGFDLVEATIGRACYQEDVSLSVRVKDKIGSLWEDLEKAPYKILFNPSVNGPEIWRLVKILRIVDNELSLEKKKRTKRKRLFPINANRLILHLVYKSLSQDFFSVSSDLSPSQIKQIKSSTLKFLEKVTDEANRLYPDSYPASIFKNVTKCREIVIRIQK